MFIGFKARAPGLSHSEQNLCQDAADAVLLGQKRIGIALVADGHGSKRHFRSDQGSRLAVAVAKKAITQFIEITERKKVAFWDGSAGSNVKKIAETLKQLESNIIYCWREAVLQDIKTKPFNEEEHGICTENNIDIEDENDLVAVYGSTLLGAVIAEGFWFAIQIGDGACVILTEEGNAEIGIPEDERLEFGRTTSLCNTDAVESFRHSFGDSILGITVASDGVTDSFIPEKYTDFNMQLLRNFIKYPDRAERNLQEFLPKLSERGSHDDVSIAGIINLSKGKQILDNIQEAYPADPAEYGDYCTPGRLPHA
ncbi:MAG: protein phosphatase 2C domain-containing protein [Treponema sp.]|jgi:serine/threonine protein phosphatase PrpC|nr:protein phosphatase 2C domain-containing protein [Treponema sp.]